MDTLPLYNLLGFLGLKYVTGIIVLAVILVIATEIFAIGGPISSLIVILNAFIFSTMLLFLALIVYVIYQVYMGESFQFMSLAISVAIAIFLVSLAFAIRAVLLDGSEFHVLIFLAFFVSLVGGAASSALVKILQRVISAWL